MKYVRSFSLFESAGSLTEEQIAILDKAVEGKWTFNPQTGLVDVDGNVNLDTGRSLKFYGSDSRHYEYDEQRAYIEARRKTDKSTITHTPKSLPVSFGRVTGDFNCKGNRLTTLQGSPQIVGGSFDCRHNFLHTLEGGPVEVGGTFHCTSNPIMSLEGAPKKIEGKLGGGRKKFADFSCNEFTINWNPKAWVKVYNGSEEDDEYIIFLETADEKEARKMIEPLITLDVMVEAVRQDPKMLEEIPEEFRDEVSKKAGMGPTTFKAILKADDLGLF